MKTLQDLFLGVPRTVTREDGLIFVCQYNAGDYFVGWTVEIDPRDPTRCINFTQAAFRGDLAVWT